MTEYVSTGISTIVIKGAAHHLDLRTPNDADPGDVMWARNQEAELIGGWINAYQSDQQLSIEEI